MYMHSVRGALGVHAQIIPRMAPPSNRTSWYIAPWDGLGTLGWPYHLGWPGHLGMAWAPWDGLGILGWPGHLGMAWASWDGLGTLGWPGCDILQGYITYYG